LSYLKQENQNINNSTTHNNIPSATVDMVQCAQRVSAHGRELQQNLAFTALTNIV
jgi:hypothetical protein